ncbi:ribokinase [soil metagenome]
MSLPTTDAYADRARVVVVGSLNVDLHVRVPQLPLAGMTAITSDSFARQFGGKGANQAIAARFMGAKVRMIGAVGDDADGEAYRQRLSAHGVDATGVRTTSAGATGMAVVMVDSTGENMIVVAGGANATLGADHVRAELVDHVAQDVILTQGETPAEAVLNGVPSNLTLVLNPAPARVDEAMSALCERAQVVVPNESELLALAGATSGDVSRRAVLAMAQHIRRPGQSIVVTRGAQGALLVDDVGEYDALAPTVKVVDTSGAGDAFCGGLAYGFVRDLPLRQAVHEAMEVAGRAVQQRGAQLI